MVWTIAAVLISTLSRAAGYPAFTAENPAFLEWLDRSLEDDKSELRPLEIQFAKNSRPYGIVLDDDNDSREHARSLIFISRKIEGSDEVDRRITCVELETGRVTENNLRDSYPDAELGELGLIEYAGQKIFAHFWSITDRSGIPRAHQLATLDGCKLTSISKSEPVTEQLLTTFRLHQLQMYQSSLQWRSARPGGAASGWESILWPGADVGLLFTIAGNQTKLYVVSGDRLLGTRLLPLPPAGPVFFVRNKGKLLMKTAFWVPKAPDQPLSKLPGKSALASRTWAVDLDTVESARYARGWLILEGLRAGNYVVGYYDLMPTRRHVSDQFGDTDWMSFF